MFIYIYIGVYVSIIYKLYKCYIHKSKYIYKYSKYNKVIHCICVFPW